MDEESELKELITRLNEKNRMEFSDLRNMLGAIAVEQIKLSKHLGLETNHD